MRVKHLFSTVVSTLLAVAVVTGCGTKTGKVENSGSLKSGSVTSTSKSASSKSPVLISI